MEQSEHRGFIVCFNDDNDVWRARKDGEVQYSNVSKKKVLEWIKNQASRKFKRIEAYVPAGWGEDHYTIRTITSMDGQGSVWTTTSSKGRERERIENIKPITKENESLIKKYDSLQKKIIDLEEQRDKIELTGSFEEKDGQLVLKGEKNGKRKRRDQTDSES